MGHGPESRPFVPQVSGLAPEFWHVTRQLEALRHGTDDAAHKEMSTEEVLHEAALNAQDIFRSLKEAYPSEKRRLQRKRDTLALNLLLARGFGKSQVFNSKLKVTRFDNPDRRFLHPFSNNRLRLRFPYPYERPFHLETHFLDLSELVGRTSDNPMGSDDIYREVIKPATSYVETEFPDLFARNRIFEMIIITKRKRNLADQGRQKAQIDRLTGLEKRIVLDLIDYLEEHPLEQVTVSPESFNAVRFQYVDRHGHKIVHSVPARWIDQQKETMEHSPAATSTATSPTARESSS